ncbi:hypothetical protein EEQ99_28580 [Rhizobium anhuiense]|uniref:Uncharacterized protein n=1 Tax=Rhizobium anhuiense TaxID=1184720 RepID=A0A432NBS2_9HYPH|nr:hypothetical protein EEQ99_28580 [Rhizobium anhuiense]
MAYLSSSTSTQTWGQHQEICVVFRHKPTFVLSMLMALVGPASGKRICQSNPSGDGARGCLGKAARDQVGLETVV